MAYLNDYGATAQPCRGEITLSLATMLEMEIEETCFVCNKPAEHYDNRTKHSFCSIVCVEDHYDRLPLEAKTHAGDEKTKKKKRDKRGKRKEKKANKSLKELHRKRVEAENMASLALQTEKAMRKKLKREKREKRKHKELEETPSDQQIETQKRSFMSQRMHLKRRDNTMARREVFLLREADRVIMYDTEGHERVAEDMVALFSVREDLHEVFTLHKQIEHRQHRTLLHLFEQRQRLQESLTQQLRAIDLANFTAKEREFKQDEAVNDWRDKLSKQPHLAAPVHTLHLLKRQRKKLVNDMTFRAAKGIITTLVLDEALRGNLTSQITLRLRLLTQKTALYESMYTVRHHMKDTLNAVSSFYMEMQQEVPEAIVVATSEAVERLQEADAGWSLLYSVETSESETQAIVDSILTSLQLLEVALGHLLAVPRDIATEEGLEVAAMELLVERPATTLVSLKLFVTDEFALRVVSHHDEQQRPLDVSYLRRHLLSANRGLVLKESKRTELGRHNGVYAAQDISKHQIVTFYWGQIVDEKSLEQLPRADRLHMVRLFLGKRSRYILGNRTPEGARVTSDSPSVVMAPPSSEESIGLAGFIQDCLDVRAWEESESEEEDIAGEEDVGPVTDRFRRLVINPERSEERRPCVNVAFRVFDDEYNEAIRAEADLYPIDSATHANYLSLLDPEHSLVVVEALRTIRAGEELYVSYGDTAWLEFLSRRSPLVAEEKRRLAFELPPFVSSEQRFNKKLAAILTRQRERDSADTATDKLEEEVSVDTYESESASEEGEPETEATEEGEEEEEEDYRDILDKLRTRHLMLSKYSTEMLELRKMDADRIAQLIALAQSLIEEYDSLLEYDTLVASKLQDTMDRTIAEIAVRLRIIENGSERSHYQHEHEWYQTLQQAMRTSTPEERLLAERLFFDLTRLVSMREELITAELHDRVALSETPSDSVAEIKARREQLRTQIQRDIRPLIKGAAEAEPTKDVESISEEEEAEEEEEPTTEPVVEMVEETKEQVTTEDPYSWVESIADAPYPLVDNTST